MARRGARPAFGYLTPLRKKLNAPRGCVFKIIAESKALSAIFAQIKLILKFCAKRWFKRPLKGGLKHFCKNTQRSLIYFLNFAKNRRFSHGKLV